MSIRSSPAAGADLVGMRENEMSLAETRRRLAMTQAERDALEVSMSKSPAARSHLDCKNDMTMAETRRRLAMAQAERDALEVALQSSNNSPRTIQQQEKEDTV